MIQVNFLKEDKTNFGVNEAFKGLRTNITFCGDDMRVIMITSCVSHEGKSSTAFNLARSFGESGKKTLFVDTDIRNSTTTTRYMVDQKVLGLTNFLAGQNALQEIVYSTNYENMHIIFSGQVSPNPVELLGSDRFKDMIAKLRREYDYIIIDTAPLGEVIDAAVIAKVCDGSALVLQADAISYRLAQSVKDQLEKTGTRILGVILSKVSVAHKGYGKYGYGKYGYGRYGKYGYGKYGYGYGYGNGYGQHPDK